MKLSLFSFLLVWVTAVSFLFITIQRTQRNIQHAAVKPSDKNFQCYVCVEGVNSNCGDRFITENNSHYLKYCNEPGDHRPRGYKFSKTPAVGCRKIDREIKNKIRIVRECAYSGQPMKNLKRNGNKGVRLYYNQCEEHVCNSDSPSSTSFTEIISILALIFSFGFAY